MKQPRHPMLRTLWFSTGVVLVILSPLVGAIPGPGGIFVFAAGLALMLQNSQRTKRLFVDAKRRWPKFGHYADMGLRRPSAARRRARDKGLAPDAPAPTLRQRIAEILAPPPTDRPR